MTIQLIAQDLADILCLEFYNINSLYPVILILHSYQLSHLNIGFTFEKIKKKISFYEILLAMITL